jgi:biotin carboxyl carrier protein
MAYELQIGERRAKIELLNRSDNKTIIAVDDIKYEVDIAKVGEGIYSILYNGKSYNLELVEDGSAKKYIVNTFVKSYNIEIIDAETKYLENRYGAKHEDSDLMIISPMPGKIVKVLVNVGDQVKAGQTLVIVEAMKMQSEFKVKSDRTIKEIFVKAGDTVNSHQVLIEME